MMRGPGRPRKLKELVTIEVLENGERVKKRVTVAQRIISVIAAGNFPTTAARACGVAESAFMNWMRLGREGKDPEYAEFVEQVKAAENQAEASAVGRINAAMQDPKLWTAAAWFLERKFPDRWGMTVKVQQQVQQGLDEALELLEKKLPREEYERVLEALADVRGGEEAAAEDPVH